MATLAKSTRTTTSTLASASAGPFLLGFRLFDDDGLEVYVNGAARTDFTLSATFVDGYDDNASITFTSDLAAADELIIYGAMVADRESDYANGDPNLVRKMNQELPRHAAMLQEAQRDSGRALRMVYGSVAPLSGDADARANRVPLFSADGLGLLAGPTGDEVSSAQGYAEDAAESAARVDLGALDAAVLDTETARDLAAKWADENEDTEVEPGQYSALHHSAKASAQRVLSEAARAGSEAAEAGAGVALTSANAARDAAFVNADVYADEATGRAAVADGDQFSVVSGDEVIRYERLDASTSNEVARYPSSDAVAPLFDYVTVAPLAALTTGAYLNYSDGVVTANGSYSYQFFPVDALQAYFISGRPNGSVTASAVWYDAAGDFISYTNRLTNDYVVMDDYEVVAPVGAVKIGLCQPTSQNAAYPMGVNVGGHGKRLYAMEQASNDQGVLIEGLQTSVDGLDGGVTTLNEQISVEASRNKPATYRPERLRRTSVSLRALAAGEGGKLKVQLLGDSWLDTASFFSGKLQQALVATYGDGGIGFVGASGLSAPLRPSDVTMPRFGTWSTTDETASGIDLNSATSSDTATPARLSAQLTDGITAAGAVLFYRGSPGLQISYSWTFATPTIVTLEESGVHAYTVPGAGFGSGSSRRLDLRLVAGELEAFGVEILSDQDGVVVHKAANNGSMASDWAAVNASEWQSQASDLGSDLVVICLGTNDRSPGTSAATFKAGVQTAIDNIRAALPASGGSPAADILLVSPHNIPRDVGPVRLMDEYRDALFELADANDCAVCNLYDIIGDNPYDKLDYFDAVGYHPSEGVGGWAVFNTLATFFHL